MRRSSTAAILLMLSLGVGCATTAPPDVDESELDEGIARLSRPLPGNLAAVYATRVARSGGLRLSVLEVGGAGRMTVSEPFGGAVSLTAWSAAGPTFFFDLEEGCRVEGDALVGALGVRALPLEQAVRLMGGRLPVGPGDEMMVSGPAEIAVRGGGWAARVRLAADPWRVVEVVEADAPETDGWSIELDDHASSVPGRIRVTNRDGRWAELDLKRLEWPADVELPALPDLPPCER